MEVISTGLWVLLGHEFALFWPSKTSPMALRACTGGEGEETRERETGQPPSSPPTPPPSHLLSPPPAAPLPCSFQPGPGLGAGRAEGPLPLTPPPSHTGTGMVTIIEPPPRFEHLLYTMGRGLHKAILLLPFINEEAGPQGRTHPVTTSGELQNPACL